MNTVLPQHARRSARFAWMAMSPISVSASSLCALTGSTGRDRIADFVAGCGFCAIVREQLEVCVFSIPIGPGNRSQGFGPI